MNLIEYHSALEPPAKTLAEIDSMPRKIVEQADPGVLAYLRGRMRRVVEYMPIGASAYSSADASANRVRSIQLMTVTALAIALAVAIFFIYKKNRRLVTERRRLHYKNEELEQLRNKLSEANNTLEESAKVKERYLGYLFNMCSDYIGSLDRYRLSLLQRVKAGKVKDITEILAAPQGNEHLQSSIILRRRSTITVSVYDRIRHFPRRISTRPYATYDSGPRLQLSDAASETVLSLTNKTFISIHVYLIVTAKNSSIVTVCILQNPIVYFTAYTLFQSS